MARLHPLIAAAAIAGHALALQTGSMPLPQGAMGGLIPMDSCAQVVDCLARYPLKPDETRPVPGVDDDNQPPRINPGYVVPNHTIGPGDPNCPSGNCIPIDPNNICDAYGPCCLPSINIRQPPLRCDPKHPRCPPNGFMVVPGLNCHPGGSAGVCPPGGLYVPPEKCAPGEHCPCGCGSRLPDWFEYCRAGTPGCPNGINVTGPAMWPVYRPDQGFIPGYPWDPNNTCNTILNPNCVDKGVVVPNEPICDARKPNCIPRQNIPDAITCDCPDDPACPGGQGNCKIVNPVPCHPNDPGPQPGCVITNPLPCTKGTPGCPNGVEVPPVHNECVPGTTGCGSSGFKPPALPDVRPDDPVIPPKNPALELDPQGTLKCSFVESDIHADGKIPPEECPKQPDLQPHFIGDSRFPCTTDDTKPCLGDLLQNWIMPEHKRENDFVWTTSINYAENTILTVSNYQTAWNKMWDVRMNGKSIGQTSLGRFDKADGSNCGPDPDACIQKDAPHGYFYIPKGPHDLSIVMTDWGDDWPWAKSAYRFNRVCRCQLPTPPAYAESGPSADEADSEPTPPNVGPSLDHVKENTPPLVPPNEAQQPIQPSLSRNTLVPSADTSASSSSSSPTPQSHSTAESAQSSEPSLGRRSSHPSVQPLPDSKPESKFPCSTDDSYPCKGIQLQPWTKLDLRWKNPDYPRNGYSPPAPHAFSVNFDKDAILTLTDAENKVEIFEVWLDGQSMGETSDVGIDRRQVCGHAYDACVARGWSHGYFLIPKGKHDITLQWVRGDFKGWYYATGAYRIDAVCEGCK